MQVYKGKLDCIELSVATRSGNKKVTLVNNLDTYQVTTPPGQSVVVPQIDYSVKLYNHGEGPY